MTISNFCYGTNHYNLAQLYDVSTMSNTNTHTMTSSLRNGRHSTTNPFMTCVVYIGKDQ